MLSKLFLIAGLISYVAAQSQDARFDQVINLNGDMNLNSVSFPDGSRIETFSQTQRQLLVNQNQAPLPGNQVTGSTGNPFVQLSQNSLIIQTNGATDLVGGQIELPFNTQVLQQNNISPDNTFVAKLASDRSSWVVQETIKSINGTDGTVRLVKLNAIDGEYIALGRETVNTGLALTQFSSSIQNAFNITGSGIQENEFTDGFRMSVRATQPMLVNTNVVNGISTTMLSGLAPNTVSINNFRYVVNTNLAGVVPNINRMVAVIQLPINPLRLQTVAKAAGAGANDTIRLSVAQRGVLANPGGAQGIVKRDTVIKRDANNSAPTGTSDNNNDNNGSPTVNNPPAATKLLLSPTFTAIAAQATLDQTNSRLAVPVSQLDGEYIITVSKVTNNTGSGTFSSSPAPVSPPAASVSAAAPVQPGAQAPASPLGLAPPASSPVAPAPVANAAYLVRAKRQLGSIPSAPSSVPAPTANGVDVTMAWVNEMVTLLEGGDALNVNAIINQYMAETMSLGGSTLGF